LNNSKEIERFLEAQEDSYEDALSEIRAGRKQGHWMWYIFPQLKDLGQSWASVFYGIDDLSEAKAYLANPILRKRLLEISGALLEIETDNPHKVMGYPDNLKLQSSMTLFAEAEPDCRVFQEVLDKFYGGEKDTETLRILERK
jgi:uncharacterized protein (DUF1810 family)